MTRVAHTFPLMVLCLGLLSGTAANAVPSRSQERVEVFATCSGRLAALATRQRAWDDPDAAENERLRDLFDLMVDTILPDALRDGTAETQPRQWRTNGWSEMAVLLAEADYALDQRRVDRAHRLLEQRLRICRALVL
ncbi:MAG: hypothetical protein CML02_11870 [Pseudooceanicola sp.]|nr:hypothetical protein [Pseudooceanicola sp.]